MADGLSVQNNGCYFWGMGEVTNSLVTEPEVPTQITSKSTNVHDSEPDEFSLHPHNLLPNMQFNVIFKSSWSSV
jgi:hypothetical protein